MAMMADDPEHPDVFLLTDSERGETHTHTHTHTLTHTLSFVVGMQRGLRDVLSGFCCLGNTYKYQAGNRMNALLWFKHLSAACQSNRQQVWSCISTLPFAQHTHCCLFHHRELVSRCRPTWCHSSKRRWEAWLSRGEGWRGVLSVFHCHEPWFPPPPPPPHCLNRSVWMRTSVCDCFGCTDYWTRTYTTALTSILLSASSV